MKYAVIVQETRYIPGDERSRTHPGHGYPAYDEQYTTLVTFETEDKLKAWIKSNSGFGRKSFTAIEYNELSYETEVVVKRK